MFYDAAGKKQEGVRVVWEEALLPERHCDLSLIS